MLWPALPDGSRNRHVAFNVPPEAAGHEEFVEGMPQQAEGPANKTTSIPFPRGLNVKITPADSLNAAQAAALASGFEAATWDEPGRVIRSGKYRGLCYAALMGDSSYVQHLDRLAAREQHGPRAGTYAMICYLRFAHAHEEAVLAGSRA